MAPVPAFNLPARFGVIQYSLHTMSPRIRRFTHSQTSTTRATTSQLPGTYGMSCHVMTLGEPLHCAHTADALRATFRLHFPPKGAAITLITGDV